MAGSGLRSATQLVTDGDPSCTKIFDAFMYCMSMRARDVARRSLSAPAPRLTRYALLRARRSRARRSAHESDRLLLPFWHRGLVPRLFEQVDHLPPAENQDARGSRGRSPAGARARENRAQVGVQAAVRARGGRDVRLDHLGARKLRGRPLLHPNKRVTGSRRAARAACCVARFRLRL